MKIRGKIAENALKLNEVIEIGYEIDLDLFRKRAERICDGYAYFYETEEVYTGIKNIDWSGAHIKHQEWEAQLNRFFILPPLIVAYKETGDEKYAEAAHSRIEDWIKFRNGDEENSIHKGDNTLNLSIRLGNSCFLGWGGVLGVFLDSAAFDEEFVSKILESIERQANYLLNHLRSDGNWRISQLDSLVFTGLRFPFLKNSSEYLRVGSRGLHNAFATQMLPDGVHEERAPLYHDWMMKVMAKYFLLKKLFPEQLEIEVKRGILKKAVTFSSHGALSGLNDSKMTLFSDKRWPNLEPNKNLSKKCGFEINEDWEPENDAIYPNAGFVFFNSKSESLAFDAALSGTICSGHSHLSRLSISYRVNGHLLLADPGILTYEPENPLMPYGKSTPAHSTLNLNGMSQADIASACLLNTFSDENFALVHASYAGGYWPGKYTWGYTEGRGSGVFGRHHRIVFQVRNEYLCVFDCMTAEAGNIVNNCWQLAPFESWSMDEANLSWRSSGSEVNLSVQMLVAPEKTTMKCYEGETEPGPRGWVGGKGNDSYPAPLVEFSYPASKRAVSAVLINPIHNEKTSNYVLVDTKTARDGNIYYFSIQTPNGEIDHIAWSPSLDVSIDEGTPFLTDAPLAYLRKGKTGEIQRSFAYNGTYLEFENKKVT